MSLEDSFHQAMLDIYSLAGKETGYWANYFLRSVKKNGGLATAKKLLISKSNNKIEKGLQALIDAGRPDISVEALALKSEFQSLFTDDEKIEASRRIKAVPQFIKRTPIAPELNHSEDLPESETYIEGTIRIIIVNAYERDPKARAACLAKYGYCCAVCDIDFSKVYGEIGEKFIHVHHKKPLAILRSEYSVNPKTDLVPVCPNCHCMLHTHNPPLGVDELKIIYERQKKLTNIKIQT